ncbi:recombinase family protein [Allokutzneria sp. A3M-2-11 16]|uniref:recombinase family protein n=1 Tax=Allokutzneria sp. A3M-2-11 16 TaxID=2962043 RepID=UPI0020B68E7C|nr:recombinase family protein [Allokutzneria sp. A3M-2-11 16]MCP3797950.1 recombinase family protein [Allokutzneria sp. A3M-2-11 16]
MRTTSTTPTSTENSWTALAVGAARAAYARLSKDKSKRSVNVTIQLQEISGYAEETGDAIPLHLSYSDNDIGASVFETKPRDGYQDLLDAIRSNLVSEIIVTEVPRLCRQMTEALELIALSKTTALRYVTTTDGMVYDLHTPRGRKAFREAVSDAEFETDQSSARQHRKKNAKAIAGAFHGGQRPYGYEGAKYETLTTPDGEKINGRLLNPGRVGCAIIEEEAAVRRECTNRIICGEREADLVDDLNRRAIPASGGGRWRKGNLRYLLMRRRDVAFAEFPGPGTRVYKNKEYRAVWPAIISKEDYELMMAAFKLTQSPYPTRTKGRTYLLSGICRCGRCGGAMYGKGRKSKDGSYQRRYGCRHKDAYGEIVGCGKTFRYADPVDLLVWEAVVYRFDTPEVAAALAPTDDQARLKELVELQTKQKLHLEGLVADYGAGVLTRDELVIAKTSAQAALASTESELSKIQSNRARIIPAGQTLKTVAETASIEWKRKIISLLVDYVEILPGHPRGMMWEGFQFNPEHVRIAWKV